MKQTAAGSSMVLLVAALGSAQGCTCDGNMMPWDVDAAPTPRADADLDAFSNEDSPIAEDVPVTRDDTNLDVGSSMGFDSGPGMSLDCVHRHAFGEDFWYLARDMDAASPSFTSVAGRAGQLVGVYSTTNAMGGRRLEVFRYQVGLGGADPTPLAGGAGGSLPTVVASSDGFWVAFAAGMDIRVARFGPDMTPIGAPVTVATEAVAVPPRIATTPSGGQVAWVVGNTIRGVALDASGARVGMPTTLFTGTTPIQQVSLQRIGAGSDLALSWADGGRPRVARLSGGTAGTAEFIGGDPGIFTSIDMGGQSAGTMLGLPLAGAAVYDLNDSGSRDVIFRVLGDGAAPSFPAATVAMGGDYAWSASVEPYLTGFALAYRAVLPGVDRTALRVGYLDREGCRLGTVTDRFVIGLIDSETGAVPQLGVDGGTMLVVWSDELEGEYFDYWASVMTCTERS